MKTFIHINIFHYILAWLLTAAITSPSYATQSIGAPTFTEDVPDVTATMISHREACKVYNYENCFLYGADIIQIANKENRLYLGDIAAPYFLRACRGHYAWGCASLGTIYKNGTPKIAASVELAKQYYEMACQGLGNPSQAVQLACDMEKSL